MLALPLVLALLVWALDLPRRLRWRAKDPMALFRLLALFALPLSLEHLGAHWAEYSELPFIATDALLGLTLLVSLILLSCAAELLEAGDRPRGFPLSPAMWATQIQLRQIFAPTESLPALSADLPPWRQLWSQGIAGLRVLVRILFLVAGGPAQVISSFGVIFFAFLSPSMLLGGGLVQSGLLTDSAEAPVIAGIMLATGGFLWLLYRKGIPPLGEWLYRGRVSDRLARCRRFGGAAFIAYFSLLNMAIGRLGIAEALAVSEVETMKLFLEIRSLSDAATAADLLWPLFVYYSLFYAIAYGIYEALFDPGAEDVGMD